MSPTKRSSQNINSFIIIDRTTCRFWLIQRSLLSSVVVTALLIQLLAAQIRPSASASADAASSAPDYDDPETQLSLSHGDNLHNEEIYDSAQLQQAVEDVDKINSSSMENVDMETESSLPPLLQADDDTARINVSLNGIAKAETQQQMLESSTQQSNQRQLINDMKESNYDEFNDEGATDEVDVDLMDTTSATTTATATATSTNMIPMYFRRKPKADGFKPATVAPDDDEEDDIVYRVASIGDTQNDDEMLNKSAYESPSQEEVMPLAMKFYQTAEDSLNNAQQQRTIQRKKHLQQPQQLPNTSEAERNEGEKVNDDEDDEREATSHYNHHLFEENYEHLTKQQHKMKMLTTAAAPTTTPIIDMIEGLMPDLRRSKATAERGATVTTVTRFSEYPPSTTRRSKSASKTTTKTPKTVTMPLSPPATTTTTTTATATTQITRSAAGSKQGKQIIISPRKLMPDEQLRNYIEDAYIRMPLAVIVDPSPESLEKTKALWRDAMRTNLNIKIVLVALNASGVPVAYSFNNTRQFLDGLNSIQEHDGGDSFIGILHASELVPFDSAVFISTAGIPPHTELVQDAAITLLKKRIRLYLMWYGERSLSENETQEAVGGILGEVALRSGGDVLHIVDNEAPQELEGNSLILVADSFRGGPQDFQLPIDTTVSSLHIKVDSPMRTATLETPNGDINLKKLVNFKSRVYTLASHDNRLDAYIPLTKLRRTITTIYNLTLVPESMYIDYNVNVRAYRRAELFLNDQHVDTYREPIAKTHENLRFPEDAMKTDDGPKSEVETFSETELTRIVNSNNHNKSVLNYNNGESITENQLATNPSLTKIEMGIQSQLIISPGVMAQLYFEITNLRSEKVYYDIQVIDEKSFLTRLSPERINLAAGASSTINVFVLAPPGTPHGTLDRITLTCYGSQNFALSANLKVTTNNDSEDTTEPEVSWTFNSRCENTDSTAASCSDRFWVMDIKAQDWQSGILRLQTTPPTGLVYRNSYTVGSTEPLRASYIATCCHPKVSLLVHDVAGNQRAVTVDVRDLVLTEASIAAIILGVLLLIALIVLLVISIVWCCRKREVLLDLPSYRSHSTRNRD